MTHAEHETLAECLATSASQHARRVAVTDGEHRLTYAELADGAARVAARLRDAGVLHGDRVGIQLPNVLAFPVFYYGALWAGAVVVPLNPLLKAREIEHVVEDANLRLLVVWHAAREEADAVADGRGLPILAVDDATVAEVGGWPEAAERSPRQPDDDAVLIYTSGTTGAPKGARLTHDNLTRNAAASAHELFAYEADDVVMGCLPLFHAFGQTCAMNAAFRAGATLTLVARFDAVTALETIERDGVTVFAGVPTMYVALLAEGAARADTSTLRLCVSGGAALPGEVLRGFAHVFGAEILEGYGLSETSPVASFNRKGNTRAGSVGVPIAGVRMRVVDDEGVELPVGKPGEIVIAGHNVMAGYHDRPDATAEAIRDGWFHSGDVGRMDAEGFFYVVDRKKELIIRGGYNVYPREIEEVLYEHPQVLEAAVVGIPHDVHGEEVGAAVVLDRGADVSADDLRAFVKGHVAAYKYPRRVWLVDELPKGATGKILKREIVPPEAG